MQTRDSIGEIHDVAGSDADSGNHEVVFHFPHERIDTHKTDFARTCFERSFAEQLPVMVWMHNVQDPIGVGIRAQVLPKVNEVVTRFANLDDVPNARRAWSQYTDGTLKAASFGFDNEKSIPHPNVRGAKRFVKARMREVSPVTFGSIPDAGAVSIREEAVMELDDAEIVEAMRDGTIDREVGNAMLQSRAAAGHITATSDGGRVFTPPTADEIRTSLLENDPELAERVSAMSIVLATDDDEMQAYLQREEKGISSAVENAALACRAAEIYLDGVTVDGLPDEVVQALALYRAGAEASTVAAEAIGLDIPTAEQALQLRWNPVKGDYKDYAAACALPGDEKLPYKNPDGSINKDGVDSAMKMIGHVKGSSDDDLRSAAKTLMSAAGKVGLKPTPSVLDLARRDDPTVSELQERTERMLARRGRRS
jgi:phage head maturation protease